MIDIHTRSSGDDEEFFIGSVIPPDHLLADSRQKDDPSFWTAVLVAEWTRWREQVPEPDSDSEFIGWLVARGWSEAESNIQVTLEV